MTKEQLHKLVAESTGNESNICQICAMKNGELVYSDCWRGFQSEDSVHLMSVTKGVMALLTGIAVDNGFILSEDQKVLDFFPNYTVKRGEKTIYDVTLKHLLTMTAPYKYRSEPWTKVCTSPDWTIAALDLMGGRTGITGEFKYATLGIQILAGIIANASGMSCLEFANKYLFGPAGIAEVVSHGDSSKEDQFEYLMSKKPHKKEWYSDPAGAITAGWGLCLSAHDLAKLGQVVLEGLIDNETVGDKTNGRVVSSEWIHKMTSPKLALGERFGYMQYGYLWYKPYQDKEVYAAIGDGGNVIYVNVDEQVCVGVTSTFKPRIFDRVEFIETKVLKAIR